MTNLSRLLISAAFLLLMPPAQALTLEQAQAELAGMSCSGSICTSSSTTTSIKGGAGTYFSSPDPRRCDGQIGVWAPNPMGFCIPASIVGPVDSSSCSATTTTVEKELIYNGPNTDRAGAWTINASTSTSTGSCAAPVGGSF